MQAPSFGKEKQDRLSNKLKIFAGTKFDIGISTGDSEAEFFLSAMEPALRGAGLVQVDWVDKHASAIRLMRPNKPLVGGVSAFGGILIEIDEAKHPEFRVPASAMALALNDEGIAAQAFPDTKTNAANADVIHILIGKK